MFGRRPAKPDPALLARASDTTDVDLGTYPEDVLAVTGAYPARHGLDRKPDGQSSFRRLDSQARKAAMQAALDRLIAEGTLNAPAGARLEDVVAGGLDGKLDINGPLADLYRLSFWFHRKGFRSSVIVNLHTSGGLKDVQLPGGVPAPGLETCFGLPPAGDGDLYLLLAERPDNDAGTRCYALRTVRREFSRIAAFLFADVTRAGEALLASTITSFRFGQAALKIEADFVRQHGDDEATGRIVMDTSGTRRRRKQPEPMFVKAPAGQFADVLTRQFVSTAGRTQ